MKSFSSNIRILIVEDEKLLAQDISWRLLDMSYEIVGVTDSAETTLSLLENTSDIHIILMDIMIKGDKDGIELAHIINEKYNIPLIFLSSLTDAKIVDRVKDVKAHAYLLKPFNDRQINIAIELALSNFSKESHVENSIDNQNNNPVIESDNQALSIKNDLFLKKNNHYERVALEDIQFLEADNNYTIIHTKLDKFLYSTGLKNFEEQLPENMFFRVHRSYLINISAVSGFEGNMLYIKDKKIPVSKSNRAEILKHFNTL
ncbi:response regulator transcription factor [Tamlana haliotis]|uniref:Response regulator transcription factor n=1 Tax=Pseudotamlana haliotis TaxID=2614804 RepID=A0A6N6ML35_9FLAO|nr:LytTR family transcriptional regulator DNA-binding domain-containing protein [Tamlana haliotis]KAB1071356.1 response regulator transcription factor [Tamlana haliotis]